jgi:cysteine sulfinate desulfinase/cysteine desulfurase-like protein
MTRLGRQLDPELVRVNAHPLMTGGETRLCNTLHVSVLGGVRGDEIVEALDRDWGIATATGSACSRSAPSVSLRAIGFSDDRIRGSIRISASPVEPPERIAELADAIASSVRKALAKTRI